MPYPIDDKRDIETAGIPPIFNHELNPAAVLRSGSYPPYCIGRQLGLEESTCFCAFAASRWFFSHRRNGARPQEAPILQRGLLDPGLQALTLYSNLGQSDSLPRNGGFGTILRGTESRGFLEFYGDEVKL